MPLWEPVWLTVPAEAVIATVSAPGSENVPLLPAVAPSFTVTDGLTAVMAGFTLLTISRKSWI